MRVRICIYSVYCMFHPSKNAKEIKSGYPPKSNANKQKNHVTKSKKKQKTRQNCKYKVKNKANNDPVCEILSRDVCGSFFLHFGKF